MHIQPQLRNLCGTVTVPVYVATKVFAGKLATMQSKLSTVKTKNTKGEKLPTVNILFYCCLSYYNWFSE